MKATNTTKRETILKCSHPFLSCYEPCFKSKSSPDGVRVDRLVLSPSLQHSTECIAKENEYHESLIRQSYLPQFAYFPPRITNWKHSNTERGSALNTKSTNPVQHNLLCILLFHLNMTSLLMHQLSLIRQRTYFYAAVPWCAHS